MTDPAAPRPFGLPQELECYRRDYYGMPGDKQNGVLFIPKRVLTVIFSSGHDWEHVSASHPGCTPDWATMCWLKAKFWGEESTVMQLHPPRSQYINNHPHCLHLWRPQLVDIPLPLPLMVGIPGFEPQPQETER